MAGEFQYDVFLSHSTKDKAVVRTVGERLRKDGLRVWFDEWVLKAGDNIPAKIDPPSLRCYGRTREGLEHSRVLACPAEASARRRMFCMSANASGFQPSAFILLLFLAVPIKGSLAQFLYINWLAKNREHEFSRTELREKKKPT